MIQRTVIDDMIDIWEATDSREEVMLLYKPVYSSELSQKLCARVLKSDVTLQSENRRDVLECYKLISDVHESLKEEAESRIASLS